MTGEVALWNKALSSDAIILHQVSLLQHQSLLCQRRTATTHTQRHKRRNTHTRTHALSWHHHDVLLKSDHAEERNNKKTLIKEGAGTVIDWCLIGYSNREKRMVQRHPHSFLPKRSQAGRKGWRSGRSVEVWWEALCRLFSTHCLICQMVNKDYYFGSISITKTIRDPCNTKRMRLHLLSDDSDNRSGNPCANATHCHCYFALLVLLWSNEQRSTCLVKTNRPKNLRRWVIEQLKMSTAFRSNSARNHS